MNSGLIYMFKYFKKIFIVSVIIFLLIYLFITYLVGDYNQNSFEVSLNGEFMRFFYTEKYNYIFSDVTHNSGNKYVNNVVSYQPNTIDLSDKIELIINEYEVYNQQGIRSSYDYFNTNNNLIYKKVNNNIKLEIKRMNETIYNGNYISDVSPYIKEKGRYYIHIYSTRSDGLFISVKTHISFNVIVGGGNHD